MNAQQKEDLVCAFHGDLERQLDKLNGWMESIDAKLSNLLLWKASVVGWSMGASAVVLLLFKALKVI